MTSFVMHFSHSISIFEKENGLSSVLGEGLVKPVVTTSSLGDRSGGVPEAKAGLKQNGHLCVNGEANVTFALRG